MSLNIKNERVHDLVRQLAAQTGQTMTSAIEDAVRRRLEEIGSTRDAAAARRRADIAEIVANLHALPDVGPSYDEIMDDMYDESGLPR